MRTSWSSPQRIAAGAWVALLLTALPCVHAAAQAADATEASLLRAREAGLAIGAGDSTWLRGNITEVFRWDGTRWLHPSWHMDYDG